MISLIEYGCRVIICKITKYLKGNTCYCSLNDHYSTEKLQLLLVLSHNKSFGSGALSGKMLLVRFVENNKLILIN